MKRDNTCCPYCGVPLTPVNTAQLEGLRTEDKRPARDVLGRMHCAGCAEEMARTDWDALAQRSIGL